MPKPVQATLILAVALVAACGSGSTPGPDGSSGSGATANPCDVLSAAQAGAVLQDGTLTAKSGSATGIPTCSWVPQSNPTGSVDLSLVEVTVQDPAVFQGIAKQSGHSVNGLTITKVNGVGDEAYFENNGNAAGTTLLLFKKGNSYIQVSVHKESFTIAQVEDAETTLAQQIMGRL